MEVAQQPIQQNNITPIQQVDSTPQAIDTPDKNNAYTYVVYGVLALVLIVLIYFAYTKFMESAGGESQSDDNKKSADGSTLVPDYNLRDELKDIDKAQANILKRLSTDVGI